MNRYSRHIVLPEIGAEGQQKISAASVLVVGAGGLGCPILQYLAGAGVGRIGIIDFDIVEASNLQRQILFGESSLGKNKALAAKARLSDLNSEIEILAYPERMNPDNAIHYVKQYDIVVDGSDNFGTRYLVNDACVISGKPLVYGAIYKFEGQVSVFNYMQGPSYRCLFPNPPGPAQVPNCDTIGVLGVLPGIIGCMMANEVLKIILEKPGVLSGTMLCYDSRTASVNQFSISRSEIEISKIRSTEMDPSRLEYEESCDNGTVEITAEEALSLEQAFFYDLREPHEQPQLELDDFRKVPMSELNNKLDLFDHDHPKILVCQSGIRSLVAVRRLEKSGIKNCYSLKDGVIAMNKILKLNYE